MITIRWKRRLFQRRDQLARKGGGSVESGHRKSNGSDRIRVKPRKTNHRREGGVVCVVVLAGKEEQCDGRQGQLWKRSSEDGISAKLRGTLPQSEEKSRTPTTASTHRLKIPMTTLHFHSFQKLVGKSGGKQGEGKETPPGKICSAAHSSS